MGAYFLARHGILHFSQWLKLLGMDQVMVNAIHGEKVGMGSLFALCPVLDYNNVVCIPDGRQSMRNRDCCTVLGNMVQGFLDNLLSTNVDRTGCFIQYQYRGLADNGSSNG